MSTGQRIAIVVIAVVVLVGAFLLAQGSGDDDGDQDQAGPVTQVETIGEPDPTETAEGSGGVTAPPAEEQTQTQTTPQPRVEMIRIRDGGPVGEPETITYESGDTVRLRFRSNTAQEVHIHGYDEYVDVPADGSATARFEADAQGVFEIESHDTGELLARLEVRP